MYPSYLFLFLLCPCTLGILYLQTFSSFLRGFRHGAFRHRRIRLWRRILHSSVKERVNPYLVWVANIKENKNPEICLELAEKLLTKNQDILMVGRIVDEKFNYFNDPDRLPSNLYYLGVKSAEEVNSIIANSIFLIHTCDPEGFPNVYIQAWLLKKPVVSLYYDPDSIIQTEKLGFVSGSRSGMAEDVVKLIDDDKLRLKFGGNAVKFARENFCPEKNIIQIEKAFNNLIKNK